jgi:antitoxin component YwqK of YwqJK toxin-antitoxin module
LNSYLGQKISRLRTFQPFSFLEEGRKTKKINIKKDKKRKKKLELIFDGEYLDGKRWKGREIEERYNNDDILIFQGEYINGILHGKEYNIYGKIIFEGEYYKEKNEKKGKAYKFGKLEFEGIYKNDNKWEGKGYDKNNNIIYELKNGNGYVKVYNQFGQLIFEGNFLKGEKNGKGKEYHDAFGYVIFEGEYLDGKRWKGKGKKYDDKGNLISEDNYLEGKIIEN